MQFFPRVEPRCIPFGKYHSVFDKERGEGTEELFGHEKAQDREIRRDPEQLCEADCLYQIP